MEISKIKSPISLKSYSREHGSGFFSAFSTHFYQESRRYFIKYINNRVYFICTYWNPNVKWRGPVFSLLSMGVNGDVNIEQNSKNLSEIVKQYEKITNDNDGV